MAHEYLLVEDMTALLGELQPQSIISRTFFKGKNFKALLFGFDAGQELSEHTASQAAIIQIVQGEATVTVGEDRHELKAGSWLHMPPRFKHSVHAKTALVMLLSMYSADEE